VSDPSDDRQQGAQRRFARRISDPAEEGVGLPPKVDDLDAFAAELDAVEGRITRVLERGRDAFFEGSDSYDHSSMAIIRLAALFEDARSLPLLTPVTDAERRGVATTRNIVAHHGYRAMDDERFWLTITTDLPDVVRRLRAHVGERRG
jgi:hypothetical protein